MQEFIAYRRLARGERARGDLRLDAQAAAILRFVHARGGVLVQDFVEQDNGKGSDALEDRPRLQDAVQAAKERGAVLAVARLDRLSRGAHLLSQLLEQGVEFAAADQPDADAFALHIHAGIAARDRQRASRRISEALQAKKRAALAQGRPNPVGNPRSLQPHNSGRQAAAQAFAQQLAPMLEAYRRAGLTQRAIVEALNRDGIPTAGGGTWSLLQLQRVLARLPSLRG